MFQGSKYRVAPRLAWLAGAAAVWVASAASAQTSYAVSLNATGLEPALLSLASQTGQQILFPRKAVAGRRAPPISGRMTPEQALDRLLIGTDLRARRVNASVVVVERVTASGPAPASEASEPRPFAVEDAGPEPETLGAATAQRQSEPTTVEELKVTGSNIRGATSPSPLLVVTRTDLERSGQTTVAAALKALPQNFGGGAAEGTATTGSDRLARNGAFGTGLNLRGLGNNATLVLINGRRIAGSGAFGDFADISAIPTAAVERVEVLLDGASAIYGSDAVGGVVNVILRKDFQGAESRILAGLATAGEPLEGQISQTFGHRWTGGSVLVAYELQRRDALPGSARPFSATADLRPFGGTDQRQTNSFPGNILRTDPATGGVVPGWAIPAGQNGVGLRPTDFIAGAVNLQNPREGIDLIPRQTLNSLYAAVTQEVGDRLEISADARLSSRRYRLHSLAQTSTLTVNRSNPFFVSPNGAATHNIAYSFVGDLPNPVQSGTADTLSLSLGGSLRLPGDWRSEGYVAFGQAIEESHLGGVLNSAFLSEALGTVPDRPDTVFSTARDGFFNPFTGIPGSNPAAVTAFIGSGFSVSRSRSRISSASLQADGRLLRLPGGDLRLALGGQARREAFTRDGSNFSSGVAPVPQASGDVARDVVAGFAELRAPIFGPSNRRAGFERLELSAAGRVEHYEAIGTTANPKLGVLWEPAPGLVLRSTWGRSFRAPALREVDDAALFSPTQLPLGAVRIRSLLLNGGNPDLRPETATSWTVGASYAPPQWPGLSLRINGFDIRFRNRIDRPVQANIVGALSDPTLASFVTRISPATNAADLARITALITSPLFTTANGVFPPEAYGAILDNRYVNTSALHVKGLDFGGDYRVELGGDAVGLSLNATYMLDYKQQLTPTSAVLDRVGIANFPGKFRSRLVADWTRERLTVLGAFNYVSAYHDALGAKIADQPTFDLQLRLAPAEQGLTRGLAVTLNARNVFDRDPPFYNNTAGVAYDAANADPVGRFVSIQLTRSW